MAKVSNQRVVGIKSSSLAMFEGAFGAVIGLGIAILYSLRSTVEVAQATDSLLSGLVFGLAAGALSIIVIPFVYFGIGWIVGYLHGFVFNVISETSGGLSFRLSEDKEK
jgi:hypothetical protein